jgi:hypothetical protein
LRQITDEVAGAGAFLFRPAAALNMTPGSDQGTPQPRDEALAENPPNGAVIDYYLQSAAAGPVTLEILDPAGEMMRRYSSDDKITPVNPDTLNIPASWVPTPKALSAATGMHRWVWDLRPTPPPPRGAGGAGGGAGRGGGALALPGRYTVKLTVDGQSYTQPLWVKMDPRVK